MAYHSESSRRLPYKVIKQKTEVSHRRFQGKNEIVRRLTGQIEVNGRKYNISVHHPLAFQRQVYAVQVAPDREWWIKHYGYAEYWRVHDDDFTQVEASNNREALNKGVQELLGR